MPKLRLSMVLLWTTMLLAAWLAWVGAGTTSAAFESSEGRWSDREDHEHGHVFRRILVGFDEFRHSCGRLDATMYRTTERDPLKVLAWWDYALNPKWAVPYRPPQIAPVPSSSCGWR